MSHRSLWAWGWTFLILACAPERVRAQVGKVYPSLEARIFQGRVVVRGTIADLKRTVLVPRMGKRDGTTWPDGIVEYTLAVAPTETLKGSPRGKLILTRETSDSDRRFEEWRAARTSFLWFVQDGGAQWDALRLGPPVPAEGGYVTDAPPLFSMNLSVLRDPGVILKRARDFAKRKPFGEKVHRWTVSRRMAERCSPSGDVNGVVVPVHPRLEEVARLLIAHPERSLSGRRDPALLEELRLAGLDALRHFPSPRNRSWLLSLTVRAATENERAREILQNWDATPSGPQE